MSESTNGKGDARRPALVPEAEVAQNWARAFGAHRRQESAMEQAIADNLTIARRVTFKYRWAWRPGGITNYEEMFSEAMRGMWRSAMQQPELQGHAMRVAMAGGATNFVRKLIYDKMNVRGNRKKRGAPQEVPYPSFKADDGNWTAMPMEAGTPKPQLRSLCDQLMAGAAVVLQDREREVFLMRHMQEMDAKQIARQLGITQQGVSFILKKARRKLCDWAETVPDLRDYKHRGSDAPVPHHRIVAIPEPVVHGRRGRGLGGAVPDLGYRPVGGVQGAQGTEGSKARRVQ